MLYYQMKVKLTWTSELSKMTKSRSCSPKLELDDDMKTEDLEVNTFALISIVK